MANRRFSVFVSTSRDGRWWVMSPKGQNGPFTAKSEAWEQALKQAAQSRADHIWVQSPRGEYVQEWRRDP